MPKIDSSDTLIIYTPDYRKSAIKLAGYFRKEGNNVILQLSKDGVNIEDYQTYEEHEYRRLIIY